MGKTEDEVIKENMEAICPEKILNRIENRFRSCYNQGRLAGAEEGYKTGFEEGKKAAYEDEPYQDGYSNGYSTGYDDGFNAGQKCSVCTNEKCKEKEYQRGRADQRDADDRVVNLYRQKVRELAKENSAISEEAAKAIKEREEASLKLSEEAYYNGMNEAWALAGKIVLSADEGGIDFATLRRIFGDVSPFGILRDMAVMTVKNAIDEYKDELRGELGKLGGI